MWSRVCSIRAKEESEEREVRVEAKAAVEAANISVDRLMSRSRAASGESYLLSGSGGSSRMIG